MLDSIYHMILKLLNIQSHQFWRVNVMTLSLCAWFIVMDIIT